MKRNSWDKVITPKCTSLTQNIKEAWEYKDLILLFVQRDFKTMYKQTILGPLWIILVPLITTLMQVFVFGNIAGISTDGIPQFLFYLSSNALWLYFSNCLTRISDTFISNSSIFGKVYFPRIVMPISTIISQFISFLIQFGIFMIVDIYYINLGLVRPNIFVLLTPVYILNISILSLGCGVIISSMTTKYRDLRVLFNFGIQLWMYISAVIYPVSSIPQQYVNLMMLNPVVPVIEAFRYSYTGVGSFSVKYLLISFLFSLLILILGMLLFNKVERTFMDTI